MISSDVLFSVTLCVFFSVSLCATKKTGTYTEFHREITEFHRGITEFHREITKVDFIEGFAVHREVYFLRIYITELFLSLLNSDRKANILALAIPVKNGIFEPLYFSLKREI